MHLLRGNVALCTHGWFTRGLATGCNHRGFESYSSRTRQASRGVLEIKISLMIYRDAVGRTILLRDRTDVLFRKKVGEILFPKQPDTRSVLVLQEYDSTPCGYLFNLSSPEQITENIKRK